MKKTNQSSFQKNSPPPPLTWMATSAYVPVLPSNKIWSLRNQIRLPVVRFTLLKNKSTTYILCTIRASSSLIFSTLLFRTSKLQQSFTYQANQGIKFGTRSRITYIADLSCRKFNFSYKQCTVYLANTYHKTSSHKSTDCLLSLCSELWPKLSSYLSDVVELVFVGGCLTGAMPPKFTASSPPLHIQNLLLAQIFLTCDLKLC